MISDHRQAMSQRSRFIPTISHTLSVSLLRNAQSPSLRRKLLSLVSNPAQSPRNDVMVDPVDDIDDHSGRAGHRTSQALCRAVEARLWAMMQRSLYHPSSAWLVLPPEDVDASVHVGPTAGLVEMSIGGPEAAGHAIEESLSYTSCSQGFFEDEFEDLFEEVPDEGDYEEFEALFSDNQIERSIDDDFEDLLEGEPPDEPDQAAYAGVEEREMDFDIIVDDGIRYWENVQNINTGGVLGQYCIENPEISDIENEGMLI
jgi:hypothetical protein